MSDQEFEYDVFLSYTEANKAEAQNLYECLRNEAMRVFFAEETIVEKLITAKIMEFGDEQAEDIAREMQTATFLKRDESGHLSFVHRSFMEFFLARKIYDEMGATTSTSSALNTCRFDRKIVYFLTHLDAADTIRPPLQQILRTAYVANVSENALQILYWSGRIRAGRILCELAIWVVALNIHQLIQVNEQCRRPVRIFI